MSPRGSSLVHHYRVFVMQCTHPFMESLWLAEVRWELNRLPSRQNQLPATSDTLLSIRPRDSDNDSPLCKTRRWYLRSHRTCQLTTRNQRMLRWSSRPQGQLHPMSRQRRGQVISCKMDGRLLCQCLWNFRNSLTRTLYSPIYSLSWSLHSLIRRLRSHAHPQFVSIWTLFLPRGPDQVIVSFQSRRTSRTELVSIR